MRRIGTNAFVTQRSPGGRPHASRCPGVLPTLLALALATGPAGAADEDDGFTPYVRGHYGYDSNLFRLHDEQQALAVLGRSDLGESFYSLAAGLDARLKLSRQAIRAHAEFSRTQFDTYRALDYGGRDLRLSWDWLAGNRLSGTVGLAETLVQASYANVQQPVANLVRTRRGFFEGAVRVDTPWRLLYGLERTQNDNDPAQRAQDATTDRAKAGVEYQTAKGSTLAFLSRYTDGRYPNPQTIGALTVDNDYRQWDNGVEMGWAPTAKTRLAGALNYTRRNYDDVPQRSFSGVTGLLALDWMVGGKTTLKASLHRDIGATDYTTASYALNNGVALGADWQATPKLALTTQLRYDHVDYAGEPGIAIAGQAERSDRLTTMHAGVEYAVLQNTQLGFSLQRGIRHSSATLSEYDYNRALFSVRSQF